MAKSKTQGAAVMASAENIEPVASEQVEAVGEAASEQVGAGNEQVEAVSEAATEQVGAGTEAVEEQVIDALELVQAACDATVEELGSGASVLFDLAFKAISDHRTRQAIAAERAAIEQLTEEERSKKVQAEAAEAVKQLRGY